MLTRIARCVATVLVVLPALLPGLLLALVLSAARPAGAEVVGIDIRLRDDAGTHERIIGRVRFAVDPNDPANRDVADLKAAPRNADGTVEFSSDLLFFLPKDAARARGAVFLEAVNRGGDQSLILMSASRSRGRAPESWDLGDRYLLEQGFALAFLGWQFDVEPGDGLGFEAPVAPVDGIVRASHVDQAARMRPGGLRVPWCAADPAQADAALTFRSRLEDGPRPIARDQWRFSPDGCVLLLPPSDTAGVFEAVYRAKGSPVAGLGLVALRDFASYLKYGGRGSLTTLRERPTTLSRVIGFGYSQTGRLFREFVRDGFNRDERGRKAFDGLFIASAGAGGGSFNHRFAQPGQAGNSVLSTLRPVDLPPFTDEGLLRRAHADSVVPRIFYTFSSTEYWARAASLTHTSDDGRRDVPLDPSSRLYLLTGTPHSGGPFPRDRDGRVNGYAHPLNFAEQRWAMRALVLDLDDWVSRGTMPPGSRYPTLAAGTLVAREAVRFPTVPGLPFPAYLPPVFRMDLGAAYPTTRVITQEPPRLGTEFPVLVPQVDAVGNELGGIALPEVAVPLGTHTGWNRTEPTLPGLRYLAGLIGSFSPLARTADERMRTGDTRPSIAERYTGKDDYLAKVRAASTALVRDRFMREADVDAVVARAARLWDAVAAPAPVPAAAR